jgi:hypothetical protein
MLTVTLALLAAMTIVSELLVIVKPPGKLVRVTVCVVPTA